MVEIDNILDVEKYISGLDAVIFDLDDTLYSEKEYVRSGYRLIAECFSVPKEELWEAFLRKEPAIDVVMERHGLEAHKKEAVELYRNQDPDIHLYPGVKEMLERIGKDKKIGIITDGRPEGQKAKIKALGLETIPFIITDELGGAEYRKPCDKAFEMMMEQLAAKETAYVGDNIAKDFIAPEKLGMRCIWFKNPDGLYSVK